MSFTPIHGGLGTALTGTIVSPLAIDAEESVEQRLYNPSSKPQTVTYTIIVIIISAILFVAVISLYDVIRSSINRYYADKSLVDPNSHNTPEDIERTQIANSNALLSTITFAIICVVLALLLLGPLIYIAQQYQ